MEALTAISPIALKSNHLALVGGLPCSATYFAAELCRDLLARKHGGCEVIAFNDLGEATLEKIAAIDGPVLLLAEIPDAAVADVVRRASFPVLMIDQSFAAASEDFMAARDAKLFDTVRTMARAQIGLNALLDISRSDLLTVDMGAPAAELAERLAMLCGVDPAVCQRMIEERELTPALREVLDRFFLHELVPHPGEVTGLLEQLGRFYSFQSARDGGAWHVPVEMLMEARPPYLPATGPFDLLGPARCLSFGPYLYLPRGRWKSVLTFTSSANRSTNTIGFDVTADEEIKLEENFEIDVNGKFSVEFRFQIENPFYPFEFRTHLRRGSIEGELQLNSLQLQRYA